MTQLPTRKTPKTNDLDINDLTQKEQEVYEHITNYLTQNYDCDHDIRQSMIGQLLINCECNEDAQLL